MSSNAIITITRMMETLPEALQNQIVEHLREYIAESARRTPLGGFL